MHDKNFISNYIFWNNLDIILHFKIKQKFLYLIPLNFTTIATEIISYGYVRSLTCSQNTLAKLNISVNLLSTLHLVIIVYLNGKYSKSFYITVFHSVNFIVKNYDEVHLTDAWLDARANVDTLEEILALLVNKVRRPQNDETLPL